MAGRVVWAIELWVLRRVLRWPRMGHVSFERVLQRRLDLLWMVLNWRSLFEELRPRVVLVALRVLWVEGRRRIWVLLGVVLVSGLGVEEQV